MKKTDIKPSNSWRVFISSTWEDMIPYRAAVTEALSAMEQIPIGMEYFVSSPDNPIEACLSSVRRSQLFILIVGMRYGSVESGSGKSFTELEYDEAVKNKIPVLAFIINEETCPVLPKYVDKGERAEKLVAFKQKLKESYLISYFDSAESLKLQVSRSVQKAIEKISADRQERAQEANEKNRNEDYTVGAELFRRFVLLPKRYSGREVVLRVRMDGQFGTWKIRDELFEAFGFDPGDAIFGNDATVIGADMDDIDDSVRTIDFFADGESADWLLENRVGTGTIFEGRFRFDYKPVEAIAKRTTGSVTANIAALVLLEGKSIIGTEGKRRKAKTINSQLNEHITSVP